MLIGKSVRLRIAEPQDAALLAGWFADPEYLGAFYNVWPESVRDWEQSLSKDIDVTEKCTMVIERSDTGEAVGTMGYYQPFTLHLYRALEIWYQVHPSARRQGIATQAACVVVNHLFDALPVGRIFATAVVGNDASCRVAEHAGMRREGILRNIFIPARKAGRRTSLRDHARRLGRRVHLPCGAPGVLAPHTAIVRVQAPAALGHRILRLLAPRGRDGDRPFP